MFFFKDCRISLNDFAPKMNLNYNFSLSEKYKFCFTIYKICYITNDYPNFIM